MLERAWGHKGRPPGERGPSGWIRAFGTACRAETRSFDSVGARTQSACAIVETIAGCCFLVVAFSSLGSGDGLEGVGHSPQGAGHRVAHSKTRGFGPSIDMRPRGALFTRLFSPITLSFLDDLVCHDGNHRQPLLSGLGRLLLEPFYCRRIYCSKVIEPFDGCQISGPIVGAHPFRPDQHHRKQ